MPEIFVISDTHFNHSNIIKYCDRPYSGSNEMDQDMIEKWNSVVHPYDHVWHLGDVYMKASKGYIDNILGRLNGKKRLILGNHDNGKDMILREHFEKIVLWRVFDKYCLTHIPLPVENIPGDRINVHGHIHQNPAPTERHINVSVEQIGYTPINIDELGTLLHS